MTGAKDYTEPKLYTSNERKTSIGTQILIAVGSATGAFIGDTLTYPFDTMNTWIKLHTGSQSKLRLVRENIIHNGPRALFGGLSTQPYCIYLPKIIYFTSYDYSNKFMRHVLDYFNTPSLIPFIPSLTATFSEALGLTVMVPMDGLRTRMQSGDYKYKSVLSGLQETIKNEGLLRLYQASPLYFTYFLIFNTLLFQTYEIFRIREKNELKRKYLQNHEELDLEAEHQFNLLSTVKHAVMATTLAAAATNPIDLVITRYQVVDKSEQKLSIFEVVRSTVRKEGVRTLNRGILLKICYTNLATIITLPIYEYLRQTYGYDFSD